MIGTPHTGDGTRRREAAIGRDKTRRRHLATTTTTVAPWLRRHRLRRHCIVIGTAVTTVLPPLFCDLFDCYVVVPSPLYCCAFLLRLHPFHHHLPSRPPLFVDCCFKRRKKPLLPTMVSSLSSRPSALVGCFRCPPQPTLAASHGSRRQLSVALTADNSTSPSPCPPPRRSDAAGIPPPLRSLPNSRGATRGSALRSSELSRRDSRLCPMILRLLGEGQRAIAVVATANARLRVVVSWFDGGGSCTASISMGDRNHFLNRLARHHKALRKVW